MWTEVKIIVFIALMCFIAPLCPGQVPRVIVTNTLSHQLVGEEFEIPTNHTVQAEVPALRILPEDVLQESIREWRMGTNTFAVRWTYTEAGANKMLAFREAHEGKKTRLLIGSFESPASEQRFLPIPPYFTNYTQWKEGWLKWRTDKVFGRSEEQAKAIAAGLRKQ